MRAIWGAILAAAIFGSEAGAMERSGSLPDARPAISTPAPHADPTPRQAYAPAGAQTSVPIGWVEFCQRAENAGDCNVESMPARLAALTPRLWREVERINREINARVEPVSDLDNYGVEEFWAYPGDGKGDCEDYVLQKRRRLLQAGLPRQALLITVVRDTQNEGHAVLTLRTSHGDFFLDNKRNEIRPWFASGYRLIKRQSAEDPNVWIDLRVAPALARQ